MQLRVRYSTSSGGEDIQGQYFSEEFEFEDVGRDDISTIVYILNSVEPRIMTLLEDEGASEESVRQLLKEANNG